MGWDGGDGDVVKPLEMLEGGDHLSTGKHGRSIGRRTPPYPLCPAGHLPQGQGLRVEPLPLVGRGWGGDFAPHKNPARLPDTLPTRGRVRDDAPPRIPFVTPLEGEMSGRAEGVPHRILGLDRIQARISRRTCLPTHLTSPDRASPSHGPAGQPGMHELRRAKAAFRGTVPRPRPPRSHEVAPAPPRRQVAENAGLRHR
jgi:hypothetical protein